MNYANRKGPSVGEIMSRAHAIGMVIPAFNIPYLPMMEPVVQAVVDADAFALIETARLEWLKMGGEGPDAIARDYAKFGKPLHTRLHLDHVPVIDEDNLHVDYLPIIQQALDLGYESVMVDASRLSLDENIRVAREVAELAHARRVPVEAELGAVLGHEDGPLPPYDELYASGKGFTDVGEATRMVKESSCDWLSVAIGNVHGAIAAGKRDQKKIEARLNLDHLTRLDAALGIPLVLHGGSGIKQDNLREAAKRGISKINVGTEIRQPYEATLKEGGTLAQAQEAVYERTTWVIKEYLGMMGRRREVFGE